LWFLFGSEQKEAETGREGQKKGIERGQKVVAKATEGGEEQKLHQRVFQA
jgi:hypothetical protein